MSLLSALLGEARASVIGLIFSQPDRTYHFRDIVRKSGASVGSVQRELALLTRLGLVHRERAANLVLYRPNQEAPIFQELRRLAEKSFGIGPRIRASLEPISDRISFAALYGSVASGTDDARSDVDLLIVGDLEFADAVEVLAPVSEDLGRRVTPNVFSRAEFKRRRAEREHFLVAVLKKPLVPLIGSLDVA